jgi:Mitochondrial ribosomal protein (VAR1)
MKKEKLVKLNVSSNKHLDVYNSNNKTPIIFNKKINKFNWKPAEYIFNDTGQTRHYPPGAQEWYNSIYTFNKNQIKTLPVLDSTLMKLLKSYFNMAVSDKTLAKGRTVKRFKRFSPRKTFVGRGDLKHTNSKVVITIYHYNTEKIFLLREVKKWYRVFHLAKSIFTIGKTWNRFKERWVTSYYRPFTLNEFAISPSESRVIPKSYPFKIRKNFLTYREAYYLVLTRGINRFIKILKITNEYYIYLSKLVEKNLLKNQEKLIIFKHIMLNLNFSSFKKYPKYFDYYDSALLNYKKKLIKSLFLLRSNMAKSHPLFLKNLGYMIESMYNKKVEFNIVELNQFHLNSDIFTQAVVLKLKNRKNSLYKVLRTSVRKVKLSNTGRYVNQHYEFNKHDLLVNKIRNSYISSMFDHTSNIDPLNKLLLDFYPSCDNLNMEKKDKHRSSKTLLPVSLETYVLKFLKHMKLSGVRIEAKGRLTKRFTASRSVFKLRWKGGLKNVDSSFKGLSTVMLRGIVKSNVQYSLLNSKNRNGAFGIKGWVGSK